MPRLAQGKAAILTVARKDGHHASFSSWSYHGCFKCVAHVERLERWSWRTWNKTEALVRNVEQLQEAVRAMQQENQQLRETLAHALEQRAENCDARGRGSESAKARKRPASDKGEGGKQAKK